MIKGAGIAFYPCNAKFSYGNSVINSYWCLNRLLTHWPYKTDEGTAPLFYHFFTKSSYSVIYIYSIHVFSEAHHKCKTVK